MIDLSLFLHKNSLGSKMRKGIRNFCNGDASTSTLDQNNKLFNTTDHDDDEDDDRHCSSAIASPYVIHRKAADYTADQQKSPTLEQMILQLEFEEELARKAKFNNYVEAGMRPAGRMSCVNNSDILRSARNALNQYPRFSLDGRDAMYQSSFHNMESVGKQGGGRRKSVCCDREVLLRERMNSTSTNGFAAGGSNLERKQLYLPPTLGGESVMWCKPGVIAKLMGLEAMPVPINSRRENKETLASIIKRQNLRRRAERHEMERRLVTDMSDFDRIKINRRMSSCSKPGSGYCVIRP